MRTSSRIAGRLTLRLFAVLLIVTCLAIGVIGLVLPIIPGLLFIAIALILVARFFPAIDSHLRRNRTLRGYLNNAERLSALRWPQKFQYSALLGLRFLVDAVEYGVRIVSRGLNFAAGKIQARR